SSTSTRSPSHAVPFPGESEKASFVKDPANAVGIDGTDHTPFGHDRRNQFGRSYVERRIIYVDLVRRDPMAKAVGDFVRGSQFDGNSLAVGQRTVKGTRRCRDVKRNVVMRGENRHGVG